MSSEQADTIEQQEEQGVVERESEKENADKQASLLAENEFLIVSASVAVVLVAKFINTIESCKLDRKSTRLNSSHSGESRMPSSA